MLTAILGIFTSSGLGALIGMLGSWLTKREEAKTLAMKYEYELKMSDLRIKEREMESKLQIQKVEAEGAIQKDIVDSQAFIESLKEQSKVYGIKWLDALRGAIRPLLTVYILGVATYLTVEISRLVGGIQGGIPTSDLVVIYNKIITEIFFLATTAFTWWYGSRPSSKISR